MLQTVAEYARAKGVSRSTGYRWLKEGKLVTVKEGGKVSVVTAEFSKKLVLDTLVGSLNSVAISLQILVKEFDQLRQTISIGLAAENQEVHELKPRCAEVINSFGRMYLRTVKGRDIYKLTVVSHDASSLLPLSIVYGNVAYYSQRTKLWMWSCEGKQRLIKISKDIYPTLTGDIAIKARVLAGASVPRSLYEKKEQV